MKRLVVFADGTWNSPANKDADKIAKTNVYKAFEKTPTGICADGTEQLTYYQEGVGTGDLRNRILGGGLGKGIDNNIKDIYRFLVENYNNGDEIFLFGFSRGAYTVRSLAGLIRNCGILFRHNHIKIDRAYFLYRSRDDKHHPNSSECIEFQKAFSHPLSRKTIKFIGVWDTVGSLGIPFRMIPLKRKYKFHDVLLSNIIENAYHAISIDERRVFFTPTLWQKQTHHTDQKLEQCWFRGVHSDVGGGYTHGDLFKIPLHYLLKNAANLNLTCNLTYSISELKEAAASISNNAKTGFYRLLPDYFRVIKLSSPSLTAWQLFGLFINKFFIKNMPELAQEIVTNEYIHEAVFEYFNSNKDKLPPNLKGALLKYKSEPTIISY